MMLLATREPEWEALPMAEIIEAVASARRTSADDAREQAMQAMQAMQAFERAIGLRRRVFAGD